MRQSNSSFKIKTALQIIFMLLFTIVAMNIINPNIVQAETEKDMNNNYQHLQYTPGDLYWAGSVDRHGMLFYICDDKGHIMTDKEICPDKYDQDYDGSEITFVIGGSEIRDWFGELNAEAYKTHFGNTDIWSFKYVADSELPIRWDSSSWYTNSGAVEEWLFSQKNYNGKNIDLWKYLILTNTDSSIALDVLRELCRNEEKTLIIEPISMTTIYTDNPGTWMVNMATYNDKADSLNETDRDDYFTSTKWSGVERSILIMQVLCQLFIKR